MNEPISRSRRANRAEGELRRIVNLDVCEVYVGILLKTNDRWDSTSLVHRTWLVLVAWRVGAWREPASPLDTVRITERSLLLEHDGV